MKFFLTSLFVLMAISFSLGEFGKYIFFLFGISPSFSFNDLLVGFAAVFLILYGYKKNILIFDKITKYLVIFLILSLCSLLLNFSNLSLSHFLTSFSYWLRFAVFSGLYLGIRPLSIQLKTKILLFFIGSGIVILLAGFLQYFYYPSLRNLYYLGWDEHLYRMFSVFLDPNFAGTFFAMFILLLIGLLHYTLYGKKRNMFIVLCLLLIFSVIALYLTYSRSGMVVFIIGLFTYLLLIKKVRYVFLAFFFIILLSFLVPKPYQTEGTNLLRITSTFDRIGSFGTAWYVFEKNPILGAGFNSYRYAQHKYGFLPNSDWEVTHAGAAPDSSWLLILATTGIVGMISFILLCRAIVMEVFASYKKQVGVFRGICLSLLSIFIGLSVNALFINSIFYAFFLEWLWILLGIAVFSEKSSKNSS